MLILSSDNPNFLIITGINSGASLKCSSDKYSQSDLLYVIAECLSLRICVISCVFCAEYPNLLLASVCNFAKLKGNGAEI